MTVGELIAILERYDRERPVGRPATDRFFPLAWVGSIEPGGPILLYTDSLTHPVFDFQPGPATTKDD